MSTIKLPRLISDGVVLQRGKAIRLWGWTNSQDNAIEIELNGVKKAAVVSVDGDSFRFDVELDAMVAGGPYEMKITANGSETVVVKDVYVGEVFQLVGQSNIEFPMSRVLESYPEELVSPENKLIREFKVVENRVFDGPIKDNTTGEWKSVNKDNIPVFSAIGYFLAKNISNKENIAVGLINTTMGGAPIETFMSREMLSNYASDIEELDRCMDPAYVESVLKHDEETTNDWYGTLDATDEGVKNSWEKADTDISSWGTMMVPSYIEETDDLKDFCGSIWLKRKFDVSSDMAAKENKLWFGTMIDADDIYVNGQLVGSTPYCYPPRRYIVPKGVLHAGENDITIRLKVEKCAGRITYGKVFAIFNGNVKRGTDGFYETIEGAQDFTPLDGEWKYKVGAVMPRREDVTFFSWKPSALYNGMVYPCTNMNIKAIVWYQGESNAERSHLYYGQFDTMVKGYRELWKDETLPVIFIQLPEYTDKCYEPVNGKTNAIDWVTMMEVQRQCLKVPYTYMVEAVGTGEYNDLHPQRKKDLGDKIAEVVGTVLLS